MTLDMAIVLAVLAGAVILFITEKLRVDMVALLAMASLLVTGIVTPEEGISGFSNTATVTVAAMFILSGALFRTGAVTVVGELMARVATKSLLLSVFLMMVTVGSVSAFINNTAAVAIFLPIVLGAAQKIHASPSKLLMPLSFASMFGGVCTLIGTSTNILVSAIAKRTAEGPFTMFELLPVGLVFFASGTLYMAVIGVRIIPSRRKPGDLTGEFEMSEYLTDVVLQPASPFIGKSLGKSPMARDLDIEVLQVFRKDHPIGFPSPDTVLLENDVLRVRGSIGKIKALENTPGIALKAAARWSDADLESEQVVLVEAVVSPGSALEGKSLKESRFRNNFQATALAIRHHGQVIHEKIGLTPLRAGDTLLLEVRRERLHNLRRDGAFVLVSEVGLPDFRRSKTLPALLILLGVVAAAALDILPIVVSSIVGCILCVLTGCVSLEEAYQSIEWKVIFLLAGVLTLGIALESTGAAALISGFMVRHVGKWGPTALVSSFYLITSLLTEVMSNNASAALLAPIAISSAGSLGVSARPFLMAVSYAASASFMTPVGYQTNTIIYEPGHYRFADFFRVGAPLNLLFWILATLLIPRFWPF